MFSLNALDKQKPRKCSIYGVCCISLNVADANIGGGGGNRTRVRKPSTGSTTCLAWLFDLARHPPTGRLMQGDPLDFRDRPRGEDDP